MDSLGNTFTLSLAIAAAATVLTGLVAVPLAYVMARQRFLGRGLLEAFVLVPLVLPPTVVGYLILVVFSRAGVIGGWFWRSFHYSVVFRFEGAVLAAAVVAVPMFYMPAKAAFQSVDHDLEDVTRTLGGNRWQVFWHVSLPLARRGLLSGLVLAFARALGEFGATLMVFGWQPGRMTLPISVYSAFEQGEISEAWPAVLALMLTSLALVVGYNVLVGRRGE
jgi:molybdate transport system permease protein